VLLEFLENLIGFLKITTHRMAHELGPELLYLLFDGHSAVGSRLGLIICVRLLQHLEMAGISISTGLHCGQLQDQTEQYREPPRGGRFVRHQTMRCYRPNQQHRVIWTLEGLK